MKIGVLLSLIFSYQFLLGQQTVNIEQKIDTYLSIAQEAEVLEDTDGILTFNEVLQKNEFTPLLSPNPNFDFTTSSYWIRFSVQNNSNSDHFYIETARPLTNVADLYFTNSKGKLEILKNGDDYPFSTKEIQHRKVVFPIHLQKGIPNTFYLNLRSDGEVITAPIKIWTPEAFENQDYKEQFVMGGYYGLLIFVVIIYFFFYVALKEQSFLHYVIYVISLFFFQFAIDGYAFQFLFPSNSWLANHAILFTAGITVVFVLKYAQEFLLLRERSATLNKVFTGFIVLTTLITMGSLLDGKIYELTFPIINGVSLISTLTIVGTIVWAIQQGYKVSKLFLAAFVFLITGAVIFILGNFNVVPASFLTEQGIKLGSAFEVIFLSLTMAQKFSEIQQEKEKAQAELLEQMDQANEKLEAQVKERTAEIREQKEILAEQNEEILDSINYAKGIQDSILPPSDKIKAHLPNSFVLFRPKDIVSGDFYWMETIQNNGKELVFFTAADCTGHGVPGGFVSMVGANGLNRCVNEYDLTTPATVLDKLTQLVENTFKERKDGMDMSLCAYEPSTKIVQWAGAHNPMFIVSDQSFTTITEHTQYKSLTSETNKYQLHDFKPNKQPVAKFDYGEPFTNHTIQLQQGDRIYLLTDGYPDQFGGPKGKKFMSKKLKKLLLDNHHLPMPEMHQLLNATIENWMAAADAEQIDDICIFGVEV